MLGSDSDLMGIIFDGNGGHSHFHPGLFSFPFPFPFPRLARFLSHSMGFPWDFHSQWKSHSHGHFYSAIKNVAERCQFEALSSTCAAVNYCDSQFISLSQGVTPTHCSEAGGRARCSVLGEQTVYNAKQVVQFLVY